MLQNGSKLQSVEQEEEEQEEEEERTHVNRNFKRRV
jgi:hypothetical protein